jgi:N-terminal domain of galactosyltransferase
VRAPKCVSIGSFYRLPYTKLFGGVEAFKTEHFEQVNGFSNLFFGWGGEDDDLYQRYNFLVLAPSLANLSRRLPKLFVANLTDDIQSFS